MKSLAGNFHLSSGTLPFYEFCLKCISILRFCLKCKKDRFVRKYFIHFFPHALEMKVWITFVQWLVGCLAGLFESKPQPSDLWWDARPNHWDIRTQITDRILPTVNTGSFVRQTYYLFSESWYKSQHILWVAQKLKMLYLLARQQKINNGWN